MQRLSGFVSSRRQPGRALKGRTALQVELLEERNLLSTLSVNASQTIRTVTDQVLGVNLAWWDSSLNTAQTGRMATAAGLSMFRFPGGSSSDDFHFATPPTYNGEGTATSMASFIGSVQGVGMVTLDYGSGSPQEAAAFLAYLNGTAGNKTYIGKGLEWNDSTSQYDTVNWKYAGFWANLRGSKPLAVDDGLNFLRINHPAPFNIHYFEVGNEEYGGWEIDHHAIQHDPATYVSFAKKFGQYAAQISPTISIGMDTGSVTSYFNNWTANVLQQCASQGFIPGFLSDHSYMQGPGNESDSFLLEHTVSDPNNQDPNSPFDWALRAAGYRALLQQELGANASKVELLATEYNSVYSNPGKQTTSLVNGLFVADSVGSILETEYNSALFWDLRNGYDTSGNNSASLYGWRQGGDYGLLGVGNSPPSTGTYVAYPTYFAMELLSKMVHTGDTGVAASSDNPDLSVYAVKEANGHLDLLIINKNATTDLTGSFQITGFQATATALLWRYGKTQDNNQSNSPTGSSFLANYSVTLGLHGANFSLFVPSYSMTVLDLTPAAALASPLALQAPTLKLFEPVNPESLSRTALDTALAGSADMSPRSTGISVAATATVQSGHGLRPNSQDPLAEFFLPGDWLTKAGL
jgi:alpha-N-arabinofuranosidase